MDKLLFTYDYIIQDFSLMHFLFKAYSIIYYQCTLTYPFFVFEFLCKQLGSEIQRTNKRYADIVYQAYR